MRLLAAVGFVIGAASALEAQAIGTFRWQLQPLCNIVSLNVTQSGELYTLDGFDDQCGAAQRAGVVGTAIRNPDGTIGFGLTMVAAPGGTPVHVDATITLAALGGTWRDSLGNSGALVFTPGAGVGGSARLVLPSGLRPGSVTAAQLAPGAVGSAQIDSTEVQLRIGGSCPVGQSVRVINQNGTVTCQVDASGTGDITAVVAGSGLSGGAAAGDVALAVDPTQVQLRVGGSCPAGQSVRVINQDGTVTCQIDTIGSGDITAVLPGSGLTGGAAAGDASLSVGFGGTGVAATVARSDHFHGVGTTSTRVGLRTLTAGTGEWNTAVGAYALDQNSTGDSNSALGYFALYANTTGQRNTAIGDGALYASSAAVSNTAIGRDALTQLMTGDENVALGYFAGGNLTTGSNNLYMASYGVASENDTTRIGRTQTRTFVTGVRGVTTANNNAVAVVIDSVGQIGTVSSTRRLKEDIADLRDTGPRLQSLRPVQFRYRQAFADGSKPIQFGLIAEEVAEVLPELVAYGADGQPETVMYHVLPSLLIAEVQRLERERAAMAERLASQEHRVEEQTRALAALRSTLEAMRSSLAAAATQPANDSPSRRH